MKSEQIRQENKHKKQWDELLFRNESSLRELEQLQVRNLQNLGVALVQGLACYDSVVAMLIPCCYSLFDETSHQGLGPVVQSMLSICQLNYQIHCYFLLEKCENLLHCKRFSHFFNKKLQCICNIYV